MIIWFLIIVPIIFLTVLLYKYNKHITWWEVTLHISVSILLIFICKLFSEYKLTSDTEYLGGLVKNTEYYQSWNEYIYQTCTRTDSKGNVTTYDCSYVMTHPEYWTVELVDGRVFHVSEDLYTKIVNKFNNATFVDLYRAYHTRDGDKYVSVWNNDFSNYHFFVNENTYTNKVQATNSVFNYPNVSKDEILEYGLFEYPEVEEFDIPTILPVSSNNFEIEKRLKYINGKFGPEIQLRLWILLFKNKSKKSGQLQEFLWKGGNKNEFVICIGIDDKNNIKWNHIFSWTESQDLKIETRNFISVQDTLNLLELSNYIETEFPKKWKRKPFSDFNYLTVEPPLSALIIAFILQIIFNIIHGVWIVKNHYD